MAGDLCEWKWQKFVEIGNTIHQLRGKVRIQLAKNALAFGQELTYTGYVRKSKERFELYETLLAKIAFYLDGNAEVIQEAVRTYFLIRHCKEGLEEKAFEISFSPKTSGIQSGFTCDVGNGIHATRYFVKTHQYGPTEENPRSLQPPDSKEVFIYQPLYQIGMGPKVHFVPTHGSKKALYIATQDCHLTLLSQLTKETANRNGLLQLDLISRILCLRDCVSNSSNCGQFQGKPMIVDFRIETQPYGYAKPNIVEMSLQGNGEFQYTGLMADAVGMDH
jgi:hypothetical protein